MNRETTRRLTAARAKGKPDLPLQMTQTRCFRCRDPLVYCACSEVSPLHLTTRVALVLHAHEAQKCGATGPFALSALSDSHLHLYGKRDEQLDLSALAKEGRRVLVLYPGEHARELTVGLVKADNRPVTLVVPDGSFRQAGRAVRRIPGLSDAEQVRLVGPQLTTFAALARALGILESPSVEEELLRLFDHSQERRRRAAAAAFPPPLVTRSAARKRAAASAAPLTILYQDESIVAVNKPSGLMVHHGSGSDAAPVLQLLRDQMGQHFFPVHRLDCATSGALLFARSPEVARDLKTLFDSMQVSKRYLAVCRGHQIQKLRVDHPLAKEKGKPLRKAVTDLTLLGAFERYGLIEAVPHTGRTHQIRRHLKHIAHPIIGDVRYGKGEHNRIFRERFGFHRLALHCDSLAFPHPRGGAPISIRAPLPNDFARLLGELGLQDHIG